MLTCRYCEIYDKSPDRMKLSRVESEKKKCNYERRCKVVRKYMTERDEVCDNFRPAKYFFCDRMGDRKLMTVCPQIKDKRQQCTYCKQFLDVIKALRRTSWADDPIEETPEPTKPNKNKLIRRG